MRTRDKWLIGGGVGVAVVTLGGIFLWSSDAEAADGDESGTDAPDGGAGPSVGNLNLDDLVKLPKPSVFEKPTTLPPKRTVFEKPKTGTKFDVTKHERQSPTDGYMYQVRFGDFFGGKNDDRSIAYRAILHRAKQVALDHGLNPIEAETYARKIAGVGRNRAIYIQAIQCVGVNDMAYGTWGYGKKAVASLHGRAIRLLKYHPNNRQRLIEGKPILRNIRLGTYANAGDGSGKPINPEEADAFEYLLLPRIDGAWLWQTGEVRISGWNPAFEYEVATYEDLPAVLGCGGGEERFS